MRKGILTQGLQPTRDGLPAAGCLKRGIVVVDNLKAWCRIEGTVQLAGKPVIGQPIWLNGMPWRRSAPRVAMVMTPITDEAGRFSFDSVPAGEWIVQRQINADAEMQAGFRPNICSHGVPVLVASGEVAQVELGGGGRPVVGKAVLMNTNAPVRWVDQSVTLALDVPAPGAPKQPLRAQFESDREYRAALDAFREQSWAFWASESASAIQRQQRSYRAMFAADGSFHLDDVPPGKYLLQISVFEPITRTHGGFLNGRELGRLETAVTVPPLDSDTKNGEVDLGSLELIPVPSKAGHE